MARHKRRGTVVILAAILLVVMVSLVAFAVDLGFITLARTELQGAADAAALAGVAKLPLGSGTASIEAETYVNRNIAANTTPVINTTAGQWDTRSNTFRSGRSPFDALQVQINSSNQGLFFGRVLGTNSFSAAATATAVVRPRDIVLVLDFSGSMLDMDKVNQLKSSVALFLDILSENSSQDRVGFVRYSTDGELVKPLTYDLTTLNTEIQDSDAEGWTNIGEGMELGRRELQRNARDNASKLMVLMTDGLANRPDTRDPIQYVLAEADLANTAGLDVYTISFGADADHSLMEQVADRCRDVHFSVTGSMSECEADLRSVFVKIATKWKIKLVQ